jgi:hypothetical protein
MFIHIILEKLFYETAITLLSSYVLSCRIHYVPYYLRRFLQGEHMLKLHMFKYVFEIHFLPFMKQLNPVLELSFNHSDESENIIKITVFWDVTVFSLVNVYRRFGGRAICIFKA